MVAERRALTVHGGLQDVSQVAVQPSSPTRADAAGRGVDAGPPQGLVCIDVAHPGDDGLGEEQGLDRRTTSGEFGRERLDGEVRGQGFGPECGQGGDVGCVSPDIDHARATESAGITHAQDAAVVEFEGDAVVGANVVGSSRRDAQRPAHPEVQHEFEWFRAVRGLQRQQEELAAPGHLGDGVPRGAIEVGDPGCRVRIPPHVDDAAARQFGNELATDGLDLRQFGQGRVSVTVLACAHARAVGAVRIASDQEPSMQRVPTTDERLRCRACGNVTRFDVVETTRTRRFRHFDLAGEGRTEEEEVLDHSVESITCRWCGRGDAVEIEPRPHAEP